MWGLLLVSLYAAYLGLKIQRTRSAQGEEKKELIKGRYNVRHFQIGSLLLGFMVAGSVAAIQKRRRFFLVPVEIHLLRRHQSVLPG